MLWARRRRVTVDFSATSPYTRHRIQPLKGIGLWMVGSMSRDRREGQAFLELMYAHRHHLLLRALFGGAALILLFIQAAHPGMHPAEVFGPSTPPHVSCPVSHAVADLPQGL